MFNNKDFHEIFNGYILLQTRLNNDTEDAIIKYNIIIQ